MSSFRAAGSGCPEAGQRTDSALSRRSFITTAALATAVPAAGPAGSAVAASAGGPPAAAQPDFGPHVTVFGPDMAAAEIQAALDTAGRTSVTAESGGGRHAFLFKPGSYDVTARLGYYTSVAGLGLSSDDVTINGSVHVEGLPQPGSGDSGSAGFWRSAENLAAGPAPVREQVLAGVAGQPLPDLPYATLPPGPPSREKPFLYLDQAGRYRVFLPALRHDAAGSTCGAGQPAGSSVPIDRFFVARPGDSVHTVNRALAQGKHLLLTPGIYQPAGTIKVKWAGTVVLGIGFPTLVPAGGVVPMTVGDARGVRIAGVLFDAGGADSRALLEIGNGRGRSDPHDPASLHDVFFRVGGAGPERAAAGLVVNSDHVLLDRIRAWRADHVAAA
ncbi:hypothetical protein [Streptomyces sp. CA-111067]|uniref:hypothetical protein n=1 Tax=Streptomyces sp. CA-111067 TaxID=3240046 RepID=UPI003D99FA97